VNPLHHARQKKASDDGEALVDAAGIFGDKADDETSKSLSESSRKKRGVRR
jgi:hypothetical protein